jgi:hypothetical protein
MLHHTPESWQSAPTFRMLHMNDTDIQQTGGPKTAALSRSVLRAHKQPARALDELSIAQCVRSA